MAETININIEIQEAQQKFNSLMADIDNMRTKLASLKKGTQEYIATEQELKQSEMQLLGVMDKLGDQVDFANISYQNLSKTMGELNKMSKAVPLAERTNTFTKSLLSMNNALKSADAQIGSYGRNVGNYEESIMRAQTALTMQTSQLVRELPSLFNSPMQFVMAISNNLPYLAEAIIKFNSLKKAQAAAAATQDALTASENLGTAAANLNSKAQANNATATTANAAAMGATVAANVEATAAANMYQIQINENQRLLIIYDKILNKLGSTVVLSATEFELLAQAIGVETAELEKNDLVTKRVNGRYVVNRQLIKENEEGIYRKKRRLSEENAELRKNIENISRSYDANIKAAKATDKATAAAIAQAEANAKAQRSALAWGNAITFAVLALMLLIQNWDKIVKFFSTIEYSFAAGSKSLKEWQAGLREANKEASKSVTELMVYSKWATMASKSDDERTAAAKEVVKIMGEHNIVVDEAGIKAGEYADQIDKVTKKLIKQAQAQAMINKVIEKYQAVLDAKSKVAEREANGITNGDIALAALANAGQTIGGRKIENYVSAQDMFEAGVEKLRKEAYQLEQEFNAWMEKFLKDFNPTDLITEDEKGGGSGSKRKGWSSYWEQRIKERESMLQEAQRSEEDFLRWSDKEWWRYTSTGQMYFENMIEEYATHYAEQLKKAEITSEQYKANMVKLSAQTKQFANDMALYIDKLSTQYIHTDYKREKKQLEDWYSLETTKYKDLGLYAKHQEELEEEYRRRSYDLAKKYRDEFYNASEYNQYLTVAERDMQQSLNDLELWYQDTLETYRRMGIDTTNLELEYAERKSKIRDEWRKSELDKQIQFIKDESDLQSAELTATFEKSKNYLSNPTAISTYAYNYGKEYKQTTKQGAAINGGHNAANYWENLDYNERMLEMQQLTAQYQLSTKALEDELAAIESVMFETQSQQEEAALRSAEIRNELAASSAQYQMEMDKMVAENAKRLWDERTQAASSTFSIMGELLTNISSLCEEGTEEYKGFAAAGAAMSAIASSVDAYKSVVGIPYVGPFLAPIAAASALLAGAAQVKQILATDPKGTNATSVLSNAYVGAMPSEITQAVPQVASVTGESERIDLNQATIQAVVVDRDLSNGLNSYNRRKSNTSF